jgi:polysaccharide biosynthesis protein PslH
MEPEMRRLRILHLSIELPHPSGMSGGGARQFHLYSQLARLGHMVTVIAPVSAREDTDLRPAETMADAGIRFVGTARRTREREALRAFAKRPALLVRSLGIPYRALQTEMLAIDMEPAINRELAAGADVVTVDHDIAAHLATLVSSDIPKVLTLHNDTSAYYSTRATTKSGMARQVLRWQATTSRRYVTSYFDAFELLIAVSGPDADFLQQYTETQIEVVPNGTDTSQLALSVPTDAHEQVVLFTGTMNYPPNQDAVLWFHRAIWPKVVASVPQARMVVVGRYPQSELIQLSHDDPRVEVTGGVPNMQPYYERALVVIAPLQSGGGTRLKILDALAALRPVVTTTLGCEGLDVIDGVHVLVADDPDRFAERVVELLRDRDLCHRIATNGRELVERSYDWRALGIRYADLLTRIADHSRQC